MLNKFDKKAWGVEYRKKPEVKERMKKYYKENREKILAHVKERAKNNPQEVIARSRRYRARVYSDWAGYIPEKTECEICGKVIYFRGHPRGEIICFDHKSENCAIKVSPSTWLNLHYKTEKNIKIWESCNFGLLCTRCNVRMPTKNRIEWLRKAVQYAGKK